MMTDINHPTSSFLVDVLNSFSNKLIITCDSEGQINFKNDIKDHYDLPDLGEKIYKNSKLLSNSNIRDLLNGIQTKKITLKQKYTNQLKEFFYLKISYLPILEPKQKRPNGLVITIKDITKKYKKSQKLLHLDHKYQALFKYSNDSIFVHDTEGKILDVNQKAEEMFGRSKEEFLNLHTYHLPSANGKERCKQAMQTLKKNGFVFFECEFISKDKTVFPVKVSASLIKINNVSLVQAIVRDVSQEKETIAALENSNAQYESLFENTAFGALIIDETKMKVLNCNKMATNMLGIDLNNNDKWDASILHKDLSKNQLKEHIHEVASNHSHSYNASVINKNGIRKDLLISCRQVHFKGVLCHLSILVDITEKRNYQRELEKKNSKLKKSKATLVEAQKIAHIGNWEFDILKNKIIWSDEIYRIFDLKVNEFEANYEAFLSNIHPDDKKRVDQVYMESLEKKQPYHITYRIVTQKGTLKYVEDRARHLLDKNQNIIRSIGTLQDITSHTKAKLALKKSQESYQSILDNMQDTYYRTNLKGELIYISKSVEALSGYTIDELLGQPLANFYHDPSIRDTFLKKMHANNGKLSFQAELLHRDKSIIWIHTNSRYWHNDKREIGGVEGFARDITQEKQASDKLAKSEERWLLALEGAKHGVWDWNLKENTVFFSKQWSKMLGYDDNQIENSFDAWLELLHPQDVERAMDMIKAYLEGSINTYQIAFRMLTNEKTYKWIMSQGAIWERDNDGKPLRMVGTHSDITELKEAQAKEKRLLDLIEASSNEIYVFEKKSLRFTYVNQGGINNLQYTPNELYTKHPYDIKPEFTEERFRTYIQPLLNNTVKEQHFETLHQRKDGTTYPVQIHLQLLMTKLTQEFLAVVIDISQQKEMDKKIKEQEEMMLVQSRHAAMGEMISMIAHQWRQPISIVGMLANTMMHTLNPNKIDAQSMKEDLQTISEQIHYMSKTIDDFRNFFQKSNAIEEVNLHYLLIEAKSILGAVFQRHNITLTIDCPISITLHTYSRELVQVFVNILSNAKDALVKVSDERNIIIHVVENDKDVDISIFNNGQPIEESIKNKIFEPYFTTKGNLGGTGLGLYMVKSILDKHMNGKITVENRIDGVAFNITLPKILELE